MLQKSYPIYHKITDEKNNLELIVFDPSSGFFLKNLMFSWDVTPLIGKGSVVTLVPLLFPTLFGERGIFTHYP